MIRFVGQYEVSLDSKLRFLFPAFLKRQMPDDQNTQFVIAKGNTNCAQLYPNSTWFKKLEAMDDLDQNDPVVEDFQRKYLDTAQPVQLDAAGRFSIPSKLAAQLNFSKDDTKDLIIITRNTMMEIWDVNAWENYKASLEDKNIRELEREAMTKKKL